MALMAKCRVVHSMCALEHGEGEVRLAALPSSSELSTTTCGCDKAGFLGAEVEAVKGPRVVADGCGPSCGPLGLMENLPCHSLHTRSARCLLDQQTRGTGHKFLSKEVGAEEKTAD